MLAALVVCVAVAEPTPAERIARGQQELDALDYDAAALDFTLAADDARATDAERMRAHLDAGIAHRILGHDTEARLHFVYVLKRAPSTALPPDVSPKIQSFYDLVKGELADVTPAPARVAAPLPTPAPAPPATSTPPPAPPPSSPPMHLSSLGPWLGVGGLVVAAAGTSLLVVGALPFLSHEDAVKQLNAAQATGATGASVAVLQAEQEHSRAAWDAYGSACSVGGAVVAVLGAAVAGAGLAFSSGVGD